MSANISIFVPHNGCPNMCSFCNQFAITKHIKQPTAQDVDEAVAVALNSSNYDGYNTEIAFFGGSFTAIDTDYMIELLSSAHKYVKSGQVCGIRVSTRPDAINIDVLNLLKNFGVSTIELGAQSMCDDVLIANNRGHASTDVVFASNLIKQNGFKLGLQMMTGLYKDTDEKSIETCEIFIELKPDFVRIYPTIVLKHTLLEKLYNDGVYHPQTVEDAANICVKLLNKFESAGIPVIRLGLHTIDTDEYVAGPWHAAFGEICESLIVLNKLKQLITKSGSYNVYVHPSMHSKTIGHGKSNLNALSKENIIIKVISDKNCDKGQIKIEEVR